MATVSVIVCVYNGEARLAECIESIISQSYRDWEIILIDDGSTDETCEICDKYADKDIRIHARHQSNCGISAARNAAIDIAGGRYLMFVDGDDMLLPDAISTLVRLAEEYPDLKIIKADCVYSENLDGYTVRSADKFYILDADELIKQTLYQKNGTDTSVSWKLYRRDLFENIRFRAGRYEDLDIFYRLYLAAGKIGVTDKKIYFYRRHPDSFINSWSESRKDIINVMGVMEQELGGRIPKIDAAIAHRKFSAYYNLLNAYWRYNTDDPAISMQYYTELRRLYPKVLRSAHSRLRNKIGAVAVMLGYRFTKSLSKWASKF